MTSLHLDTRPDWRGGQNQVLLTLRGLRARGHGAELMALEGSPLERRARAEGFQVHAIPREFVRYAAARRLRKLLPARRFDVVHAHDPHGLTAAWLAGAHRRSGLVASRRVGYPLSRSALGLARYRATRRILAISQFVAQSVIASGIAPELVRVVYEGVELPAIPTPEMRLRARQLWGVREGEVLLGCVGYLVPGKGQEVLLRALPAVRQRFPGCRLLLVGGGPCLANLERLARELEIEPGVTFAGFVEDVAEVYRALDVFLFPAIGEGLGSSLLAAMAHSLPVIAVASGGVNEIVESNRNGLLVPSPSWDEFAKAILHLLEDRAEAKRLAAAARERIAERFSADRMVDGTLEQYRECLAAGSIR
jgi:glycosyltransferase involved in cell wall biosynthesis